MKDQGMPQEGGLFDSGAEIKKLPIKAKGQPKQAKLEPFKAFSEISSGKVIIGLPIRTVSESNSTEHWTKKAKRHKRQQNAVIFAFRPHAKLITLPCTIKLTRYAPRSLDLWDNLPMSMKWILDAVCGILRPGLAAGRADDSSEITVSYDQIKCKDYGVKIEIRREL